MQTLSLNGTWKLSFTDDFPEFLTAQDLPGRFALDAAVPAPVHQVLMDAGLLDDPRVGLNSLKARWVEESFWGYRRTFATPEGLGADTAAWLVFACLELNAVVYLNGEEVGRHANAHRPARFDVTGRLRADGAENRIVVLLESGLFANADKPGAEYRQSPQASLTKIHWQRRGQWQRGWDWQQRLLNVGILGDVCLEWADTPVPTQVQVYALPSADLRAATVHAKVSLLNRTGAPVNGELSLRVGEGEDGAGPTRSVPVAVPEGDSDHAVSVEIENPRLWWPVGHGEPFLYSATVAFTPDGAAAGVPTETRRFGVRKVEVDQSPHPVEGRHFTLRINDRPIFCKGGNWVPADMLWSTVTPERYREYVDLAREANFNLLRIWGGGVFADRALLDRCDETGVLVWHDLLFACSKYPGDYPEFAAEVRREVAWAMREMAHHPSLVVWCGNNEIEEADWHWGYDGHYRTHPHYALFHHDLPQIASREAPYAFYWISSPYSPDYRSPRDPTVGDQHPWKVSLQMPGGADWWEYRAFVDRFPNEGGVLGCSTPATLRAFLPERERRLLSPSWEHHDNPFAINDTRPGNPGHAYQTVRLWTGLDPFSLDWERYAFVSGLLQAEGLAEYIANYRRRMFSSASAIFWMYNDSWPATHSWTIVDYYRRKRLPYHPVRRAFAPITVVAAPDAAGNITFTVVNDTPEPWTGRLRRGAFDVRGAGDGDGGDLIAVTVAPNSAFTLADGLEAEALRGGEAARRRGALAVLYDAAGGEIVAQHRVFVARFGELDLVRDPKIETTLENGVLTLRSDVFVWGVCLDENGDLPVADNCFDLLPGVPYRLPWDVAALGPPRIARLGNRDALGERAAD